MYLPALFPVLFAGTAVSLALLGIVILQTWNYFNVFSKDRLPLKMFVVLLCCLDTASSVFLMMWAYRIFITEWNNKAVLEALHWTLLMDPILVSIITALAFTFFAVRINTLLGRWWISASLYALSAVSLCGGIASGITSRNVGQFERLDETMHWYAVWLWPSVAANATITASMSFYMYQHRERINQTEALMSRMLRYMVQNGSIAMGLAMVQAILFQVSPDTPYHLGISFVMPKIYVNMVLSTLHNRKFIVRPDVVVAPSTGVYHSHRNPGNAGVFVNVETTRSEVRDYNLKEDWEHAAGDESPVMSEKAHSTKGALPDVPQNLAVPGGW
ncbi:hypothetical protein CYLTODRAFT_489487 [Cylindrobasidium torrendii FP15055 ss-10]|uniref:DUF6534 domain-containing protein n=1 Tax=Cylindrobasidium torrendii FP15055 ss-10 TaxID=1314674 RepID=A0A0D7BGH3_9AGAR|nr:hypothetical protein CYLTODRAFT_489487 [Cylindrobasidium torrendii FP15055 ss-10]